MSRLNDALLARGYNSANVGAHTTDGQVPALDLRNGGMHGWAATPRLHEYVSNQAYVSRPLICVLLEAPKMFGSMPQPEIWRESLRALFEVHARSIEGLTMGLTVDTDEHAIGGGGEQQEEFVNVTRERSQPRFQFIEKYGRPIQKLIDYWIRYGMMDPETKFALLATRQLEDNLTPKDLLADWYTATCLFFEPDPLHLNVDKAWLTTNMFPKTTGDMTSKRDLTSGQEILTLDIEFSGMSQVGHGVNMLAQEILNKINIANADPFHSKDFASQFEGVGELGHHADLVDNSATSAYRGWAETVGKDTASTLD